MAGADLTSVFATAGRSRRQAVLDWLVEEKLVEPSAVARAELVSARKGEPVEQVLNQLGSLSDDDLVAAYAEVGACQIWDPNHTPVAADLPALGVSSDYLRRARILPLQKSGKRLVCAACDPFDDQAISGLVFATGLDLTILAARPADWRRAFDQACGAPVSAVAPDERRLERELDLVSDRSAEGSGARLVSAVFEAAIAAGASDIHFEPTRHNLRIRLRVDGRLVDFEVVSADLAAPAVSRVKVMANLNLGERRLPQDGRTTFVVQGKQVDVRVATSPTVFGESAVLRILDRTAVPLDLDALGLSPPLASVLKQAARAAHGLFLVSGPTGSGKTTTLYALLQTFVGTGKKVLSVEDPVEYHFEHVSQTQVAPQVGLTFAAALRSFLRQDPDIILVGEIRDPETAAVAVQAAMTGHFVLASVHANSALAVLPRLRDIGVEPYQLAAGFRGAVAQRLVRRLCSECAEPTEATDAERVFAASLGLEPPAALARARGCRACKSTGYKGRLPIGEAFEADEALLRALAEGAPAGEVERLARASGLRDMAADGADKALCGLTTFEEVAAAVHG